MRDTSNMLHTSISGHWLRRSQDRSDPRTGRNARWIAKELEQKAQSHAIGSVVPEHLAEVRNRKLDLIAKTEAAVKDRLTKEINYWDHRAADLKAQEQAGKVNARLNSDEATEACRLLGISASEANGRIKARTADLRASPGRSRRILGRSDRTPCCHDRQANFYSQGLR